MNTDLVQHSKVREANIVAKYRAGATMEVISKEYGISRERIRQIIKRYETRTGDSVPRYKQAWHCAKCGKEELRTRHQATAELCSECTPRTPRAPHPSALSDEFYERVIEARRNSATWADIARTENKRLQSVQNGLLSYLKRNGRLDEVSALWAMVGRHSRPCDPLSKTQPTLEPLKVEAA
jgi:hypothetical protein